MGGRGASSGKASKSKASRFTGIKTSAKKNTAVAPVTFKNKKEFISFVKQQTNITLPNEKNSMNSMRNVLYTNLGKRPNQVLNVLNKNKIYYEEHLGGNYWIYYKMRR